MKFRPHVTVAAILERDDKLLLIEERSNGQMVVNNPAGHVERDETLEQAVVRETLEETGWLMRPTALVGVYQWRSAASDTDYVRFTFSGELLRQEHPGPIDDSIEGTLWLSLDELCALHPDRLRSPSVVKGVRDWRMGRRIPLDALSHLQS